MDAHHSDMQPAPCPYHSGAPYDTCEQCAEQAADEAIATDRYNDYVDAGESRYADDRY